MHARSHASDGELGRGIVTVPFGVELDAEQAVSNVNRQVTCRALT